ncbi:MAG: alginate export family protein [Fimbriimonadaceae bacterium]|nr:alginate export family protein [Fimbriimonadaceae bacterium]
MDVGDVRLTPFLETRYRFERRLDRDFDGAKRDDRNDSFLRVRPGFVFETKGGIKGKVTFQFLDNRTSLASGAAGSSSNMKDLAEAYVDAPVSGATMTLGRQKVIVADQRLIGALEWANSSRAWDGLRYRRGGLDVFAGRLAVNPAMNQDAKFGFLSYAQKEGQTVLSLKADSRPTPETTVWTLSHRWTQKHDKDAYQAYGALQQGSVGGKKLEAFAFGAGISRTLDAKTSVSIEGNLASGGGTAAKTRTFDQLYPTGHQFMGAMDMQGLRNTVHVGAWVDRKLSRDASARVELHRFWLYDAGDAWYSAAGGPNAGFKDATGKRGKDVGWELDLTGSLVLGKDRTLALGVAAFLPGDFTKSFATGASRTQYWAYAMVSARF